MKEHLLESLKTLTLPLLLKRTTENFPNRPALSMVDSSPITYTELLENVERVSHLLKDRGVIKGDRVAILSENCPNWGIAYFAITSMGAVVVPILNDFHPNEINYILKHSGTKTVFVSSAQFSKIGYSDSGTKPDLILIEDFSNIAPETEKDTLKQLAKEGSRSFSKFKERAMKAVGLISSEVKEDDLAAIIYTSGTTGSSKGVMLSHRNLVYDAFITLKIQNVNEHDRLISILPLAHTYECTIGFLIPMMQGASIYYLDKPPTARVLVPAMQKIKPTMILTVPLVIEKIFKMQVYPQLNSNIIFRQLYKIPMTRKMLHRIAGKKLHKMMGGELHFFGIGGALLSPEVERFLWDADFPYAIGYGLTETSPLIAGCAPAVVKFRATGVTLPGIDVRIANPDMKTGEGEIQVKGDTVMKGYYHDKERTEQAFTEDGWFKTGDLGIIKKKNYLYIKGRIKNVIVGPSGENIYPEEIESILNEQECVLESLVYESDRKIIARVYLNYEFIDSLLGIQKMSSVQAEKQIKLLLDKTRDEVNKNVSTFSKIHRILEQKEPFVKTPTQKIKRYLYQD